MKKVLIALIGGTAMSFASLAQAADLPYRKEAPTSYDYPPTFTWTGFYFGGTAGVGFGGFDGAGSSYFGRSPGGGAFGVTAGYNYQSGNLLVGGEGDYAWTHIADSASPGVKMASSGIVQNIDTARVRVGYTMDRALLFVTGGYAGADIRALLNGPGVAVDQTRYANGFALGLGGEYALTPHITAKAEYLYTSLGSNTFFNNTPNFSATSANISLLRGGLNYKF
jgi:outer membrane immunogenic protein